MSKASDPSSVKDVDSSSPSLIAVSSVSNPPRRYVGSYVVTKRIGSGSFAHVWRGYHQHSNLPVAVKSISRNKLALNKKHSENLTSEIEIMKELKHPNIVNLFQLHQTERHIYLIMEYMAGGDLSQLLRKQGALSLELTQHLAIQLMRGMKVLHERQLIHRDLKPQNLLLDQSTNLQTALLKIAGEK